MSNILTGCKCVCDEMPTTVNTSLNFSFQLVLVVIIALIIIIGMIIFFNKWKGFKEEDDEDDDEYDGKKIY